jgi:hypothetical protein
MFFFAVRLKLAVGHRARIAGFTLLGLLAVLVIVGMLVGYVAVVVAPRYFDPASEVEVVRAQILASKTGQPGGTAEAPARAMADQTSVSPASQHASTEVTPALPLTQEEDAAPQTVSVKAKRLRSSRPAGLGARSSSGAKVVVQSAEETYEPPQ